MTTSSVMAATGLLAVSLPLDQIDVSDPKLYQDDVWEPYFARLRCEDPVHLTTSPVYRFVWSVTRYPTRDVTSAPASMQC